MKHLHLVFSLGLLAAGLQINAQAYRLPQHVQEADMVPGKLIVKLKESNRHLLQQPESMVSNPGMEQVLSARALFPHLSKPRKENDRFGRKTADISRIVELNVPTNLNLRLAMQMVEKSGLFEWVQPRFVHKPMFTPNDPQVGQQYHHALIKSFEAWDIEQGDTSVFIGITDAGIQFDHQDLGNVRFNYADPINGLDDDNNGYVDDFRGWNTVSNTNDPTATLSPHGMFTTGMSSATVNNGIGIAGNAFRCKFVPVRIDDANGFNFGYEGIVYLADLGCKIINASWGNTFPTPFGAEVIQYATVNHEALIIAAAGNSGLQENYYPAAYPGVMSIGATGSTDQHWSLTTWGPSLDMVAPGELVRSCWPFNGYDVSSGTSFSAPLVAGAAAILKSHFPNYTSDQIAERLRVTADTSIYALSGNASRYHWLGAGRLNMLRALNAPAIPSIRIQNESLTDNDGDNFAVAGDTLNLSGDFFNWLDAASNLVVTLSCDNPSIEILNGTFTAGAIASLAAVNNQSSPFQLRILPNAAFNLDINLKLSYRDEATGYSGFEYLQMRVNRDYINLAVNNLHTTITSRGSIGYNADYATDGIGIQFQNSESLIYASGFMMGSGNTVSDNVYAATLPGYDNDFNRVDPVELINPSTFADREILSRFASNEASLSDVAIQQRAYASNSAGNENYVVIEYRLSNNSNEPKNNLGVGIFNDWDIGQVTDNQTVFDAARKLAYAFDSSNPNRYLGVKVLSNQTAHAYCFNSNGASGSINLYDGFSNAEKASIVNGTQTRNASTVGDIATYIGVAGINLEPDEATTIRFAILGASSLTELEALASSINLQDNLNQLNPQVSLTPESCTGNDGSIEVNVSTPGIAGLSLLNADGVELVSVENLEESFIYGGLPAGEYLVIYAFADGTQYESLQTIAEATPVSLFEMFAFSEFLLLPNAETEFTALANGADTYFWDFGDGNTGSGSVVTHEFTSEGIFTVTCIASNGFCSDTSSITIEVGVTVGHLTATNKTLQLFPNPAQDRVFVDGHSLNQPMIQAFDLSGRVVWAGTLEQNSFSVAGWTPGVYFIQIEKQAPQKLVVTNKF